jgi:hypothetical protein
MTLEAYRLAYRLSYLRLARHLNMRGRHAEALVRSYALSKQLPTVPTVHHIFERTRGAVTPSDFFAAWAETLR